MAIVCVQAAGPQAGQRGKLLVDVHSLRAGCNAGAVHAAVHIQQHFCGGAGCGQGCGQSAQDGGIVRNHGEARVGKGARKLHKAPDIGADGLVREHHIKRAGMCGHLGFGDGGTLKLVDAGRQLELDDLGQLVGFYMRAQARGSAGEAQHVLQICLHAVRVNQQRRRGHLRCVRHLVGLRGHLFCSGKVCDAEVVAARGG